MDEFLCVTEEDLRRERALGTTILTVHGVNMVGRSKTVDLSDIDLQKLRRGAVCRKESKHLCFLSGPVREINYRLGACAPTGRVRYSAPYLNKHMCFLGLPFVTHKYAQRYLRAGEMRKHHVAVHYTQDAAKVKDLYRATVHRSTVLKQKPRFFQTTVYGTSAGVVPT